MRARQVLPSLMSQSEMLYLVGRFEFRFQRIHLRQLLLLSLDQESIRNCSVMLL
jgi:hypothetical protein